MEQDQGYMEDTSTRTGQALSIFDEWLQMSTVWRYHGLPIHQL